MINCPKCGVPNPDNSTSCVACGTALASQQFAQALDAAQQQMGQQPQQPAAPVAAPQQPAAAPPVQQVDPNMAAQQPAPGVAPQQPVGIHPNMAAQQPAPMDPGVVQPGFGGPVGGAVGQPMDPNQAQAEINQFLAEQKSRKRTKTFIYLAIAFVLIGVGVFYFLQSMRVEARKKEVYKFYTSYLAVQDQSIAGFWKCTVRAKHRDVRLAKDTSEVTDGLQKAFANFPKSQPDRIKDRCVPMIPGIIDELQKLKAPEGFGKPIKNVIDSMEKVKVAFMAYANKIEKRKGEALIEAEIRKAQNDFHMAVDNMDGAEKALMYWNILKCAIPDLYTKVKKISKPPDSQPVVEYVYETCKADAKFADKLRKECYEQRNANVEKDAEFKKAVYQMSGDNRDGFAIEDCFKRANRGFDLEELTAVAKAFVEANKAHASVLNQLAEVKKELAD